jgi:hypothetical protein
VKRKRSLWRRLVLWLVAAVLGFYSLCILALVGLKWIDPPTTMVQTERRVQALAHRRPYRKNYTFVSLRRISKDLQHAFWLRKTSVSSGITASIGQNCTRWSIGTWTTENWGAALPRLRNSL